MTNLSEYLENLFDGEKIIVSENWTYEVIKVSDNEIRMIKKERTFDDE